MDILNAIVRKKPLNDDKMEESKLNRILTVFDLTALGVGATLGEKIFYISNLFVGMYVSER